MDPHDDLLTQDYNEASCHGVGITREGTAITWAFHAKGNRFGACTHTCVSMWM